MQTDEEARERSWMEGNRAAYASILQVCIRQLGCDNPEAEHAAWLVEKQELSAIIRRLCVEHGDDDYPDNLHLGDVLTKYLEPYLEVEPPEGPA